MTGNADINEIINIPGDNVLNDLGGNKVAENRLSCDVTFNNYGRKLNSLCKEHNLVIANGRIPGDRIGNFTCHTNRGDSVVDYFLSDYDFFGRLKKLVIHDPLFGSVHSPMSLTVDCVVESCKVKKPPLRPPPKFF